MMAPVAAVAVSAPQVAESTNLPLADYFFISGIESSQVVEEHVAPVNGAGPSALDDTIDEDNVLETIPSANTRPPSSEGILGSDKRHSAGRPSFELRRSVSSGHTPEIKVTASNRSSATIKGMPVGGSGLSEADFDNALRKFAAERELFLEEIQFSAGTVAQVSRSKARPKTQRFVSDDSVTSSPRSGVGSLRRRISTMSSLKRQPSMARQCKNFNIRAFSLFYACNTKLKSLFSWILTVSYSFDPNCETNERIQFRNTSTTTLYYRTKHASSKASIRARSP